MSAEIGLFNAINPPCPVCGNDMVIAENWVLDADGLHMDGFFLMCIDGGCDGEIFEHPRIDAVLESDGE